MPRLRFPFDLAILDITLLFMYMLGRALARTHYAGPGTQHPSHPVSRPSHDCLMRTVLRLHPGVAHATPMSKTTMSLHHNNFDDDDNMLLCTHTPALRFCLHRARKRSLPGSGNERWRFEFGGLIPRWHSLRHDQGCIISPELKRGSGISTPGSEHHAGMLLTWLNVN